MKRFFTSESVTNGHPDKVADQISDGILDELLSKDSLSRVACETTVESGAVHVMGEITTKADVDYEAVIRRIIRAIGYTKDEYGFTDKADITVSLHTQSPDICQGVDRAYDDENAQGAGDQGIMFGYATNESEDYLPLTLSLARKLTERLREKREDGTLPFLGPDGKSQVTVEYDGKEVKRIDAVVVSTQHDADIPLEELRKRVMDTIILPVLPKELLDSETRYYINPTGRFVYGGPAADTGLTGRKIIVDTYGGKAHHGGGAFSGKDPSKVDRSAAYALRNIAKTVVEAGAADECELQASYAIGVAKPISIHIDTFGTGKVDDETLLDFIGKHFDLRPQEIIRRYDLRKPCYFETAARGHFGNEAFAWEQTDRKTVEELRALVK